MASPLVVIVGETGSGKTALAIELAGRFNGEIIAADSRTVYKGLDIATAKPTAQEQAAVRHHLLDVVTPDQPFTAADFQRLANEAIVDIWGRGKLPIMVGGTGLYIDAILYGYQFRPPADVAERARLEAMSVKDLRVEIEARGLPMPENASNPRHLSRVLETNGAPSTRQPLRSNTLILGLQIEREVLQQRITTRVQAMIEAGVVEEARHLFAQYGNQVPALETPGYSPLWRYLNGSISLAAAQAEFVRNDCYLAKRQRTWFKRNKSIHWLPQQSAIADADELITTFLSKK